jgi:carboxymethylenebutenolidase
MTQSVGQGLWLPRLVQAIVAVCVTSLAPVPVAAQNVPWTTTVYPQDAPGQRSWWDDGWWENGTIEPAQNFAVTMEEHIIAHGNVEIPAYLFRPRGDGPFAAVLFQHGRRGLDDITTKLPRRLAARGFLVLAPDIWSARFIEKYPIEHNPLSETDVAASIDYLLALPEVAGSKACVVSHTRGGYLTLRALVTHGRQSRVACYASYYPHWQNPNAPEPMQVYRFAPEVEELRIPTLVLIGEYDQYSRIRSVVDGVAALQAKSRPAQLFVYPGVGRGFDFRPRTVRTFADDLAAKDAAQRVARFVRRNITVK